MSRLRLGAPTLANAEVLNERRLALFAPHISTLERYRENLGARAFPPPHFDPFDGGVRARLLVLLETPGPSRASVRFVSLDNPTGTAANLRRAFEAAKIVRTDSVLWNTVPWVLYANEPRRAPRGAEVAAGLSTLSDLLDRLPNLRVVILAGRVAALAEPVIAGVRPGLGLVKVAHPSPTYVNTRPHILPAIFAGFAEAKAMIDAG